MEATQLFESQRGLQLSSVEWLLDHHEAKERERRQMVDDLYLRPGELVLDLGCGPGLWTAMFAEKVAPGGKVIGADFSPELIEYGVATLAGSSVGSVADFVLADFYNVPFGEATFDVVFFGNCCAYVTDIAGLLQEHRRVTKPGGRVISKEFDGGAVIFHPMDPHLLLKVLEATARGLAAKSSGPYFDNFVGRKMCGDFKKAGLRNVSTTSYAIQKVWPLSPEAKRYLIGNGEWYGRMAAPYLTEEEVERWNAAFDPSSDHYILDRQDFYFCMLEMVTVGVR